MISVGCLGNSSSDEMLSLHFSLVGGLDTPHIGQKLISYNWLGGEKRSWSRRQQGRRGDGWLSLG